MCIDVLEARHVDTLAFISDAYRDDIVIEGGPEGRDVGIGAGDVLVLPAGTGQRRIDASNDFLPVGAYPAGQNWDVCREAADRADATRIAVVPLPTIDPINGVGGPLVHLWSNIQ